MKNENKFYAKDYSLGTPFFRSNPQKLLVVSDMHYQPNVDRYLFELLIKYASETSPDFIVMPGDLIETIDFIDDFKEKNFFEYIIKSLSEIAPVIIVPGNHEIKDFSVDNFKYRLDLDKDTINYKALKYLDSLNRFNNVYFLNNEKTNIKGTAFFGFNPRLGSYLKINDDKIADEFIEDYIKSGFQMAEDEYNILLTHSPIQINNPKVIDSISDFSNLTDLIISGHLHDGYLPKFLDKIYGETNVGLFFTPLVAPIPGIMCRGIHNFGRGYLFISQGFRKWTTDLKITNDLERITANDVENLDIFNSKEKVCLRKKEYKPFKR